MKYYKCGHIMTTHGIKGDLKVKNLSDFDRFYKGSRIYILFDDKYCEEYVEQSRDFNEYLLVSLKDKLDINLVEKYRNCDIYISELDRDDDLGKNEFYYSDLVGKRVINEQGEDRGIVKEVREYPTSEYLVVDYNGKNVLIPFTTRFTGEVTEDTIVIKEIEGLF